MGERPRGRPRSFDLDAILKIVAECFREGGYSATSLDDIVEATGLKRPSLYAAYGDKKAMYLAAIDRYADEVARAHDRLDAVRLNVRETIAALFAHGISVYLGGQESPRGCLVIGTATVEAVRDPDIRAALRQLIEAIDARIERWLETAGVAQPAARARLIGATLHSLSIRARAGASRDTLEHMAGDAIELLLPR